jgi:hypothetical protein
VSKGAARNYRWREAQPGNDLALKHGAHSEAQIAPVAAVSVAEAIDNVPWLDRDEYSAALNAWARAEARCDLIQDYLSRVGLLDDKGKPRPAAELALRLERQAAEARARLGLDPASRAAIERSLSASARDRIDVAGELAAARRIREQREAEMAAPEPSRQVAEEESHSGEADS